VSVLLKLNILLLKYFSATTPLSFTRLPSRESGEGSADSDRSPDTGLDAGTDDGSDARKNSTSSYSESGAEDLAVSPLYR